TGGKARCGIKKKFVWGFISASSFGASLKPAAAQGSISWGRLCCLAPLGGKLFRVGAVTEPAGTAELAGGFLGRKSFKPAGHELADHLKFVEVIGVTLSARDLLADLNLNLFAGRDAERQQILRALDQVATGGRVIGIVGDPGLGKTRLSIEVARSAR